MIVLTPSTAKQTPKKPTQTRVNDKYINLEKKIAILNQEKQDFMISREAHFQFLCGSSFEKFNMYFETITPYTNALIYPDCKGDWIRTLDNSAELLTYLHPYLMIRRHSLHLGAMLNLGESFIYLIFYGWAVVLEISLSKNQVKVIY